MSQRPTASRTPARLMIAPDNLGFPSSSQLPGPCERLSCPGSASADRSDARSAPLTRRLRLGESGSEEVGQAAEHREPRAYVDHAAGSSAGAPARAGPQARAWRGARHAARRGVRVAQIVDPDPACQVRRLHGRVPDGVAEPVRGDMPVRGTWPHTAWVILAVRTAGCPVAAVGVPAVT